jgi:hypothetical protein
MTTLLERLHRQLILAVKRNDRIAIANLQVIIRRAGA